MAIDGPFTSLLGQRPKDDDPAEKGGRDIPARRMWSWGWEAGLVWGTGGPAKRSGP